MLTLDRWTVLDNKHDPQYVNPPPLLHTQNQIASGKLYDAKHFFEFSQRASGNFEVGLFIYKEQVINIDFQ